MPKFILKDRNGNETTYEGDVLTVPSPEGEKLPFTYGAAAQKEVELDMAEGDQVLEADEGTVLTAVTVKKPETLVPENIRADVKIAGIEGTYTGSGSSDAVQSKAINFYDPFGELLYSYTRAETAELTELPIGPELEGFTFSTWTHTLDQIQSEQFFCDVAPLYKKDGYSVSVMILEVSAYDLSVVLNVYHSSTMKTIVDWGDGTTNSTYYGSTTSYGSLTHTYSEAGTYFVSARRTGSTAVSYLGSAWTSPYQTAITEASNSDDYTLLSILSNSASGAVINTAKKNRRLRIVANDFANGLTSYHIEECSSLDVIAMPSSTCMTLETKYDLHGCSSLSRLRGYTSIFTSLPYSYTALGCDRLKKWVMNFKYIHPVMNYKRELVLPYVTAVPTTIPSGVTSIKWGAEPIYVPDDLVEDFKASEIFSVVADCIRPISEYPDF